MDAGKFIVIQADGKYRFVEPEKDEQGREGITLKRMQEAVGGYIERVSHRNRASIDIWVNEEGKMLGLEINPIATALSTVFGYDVLVGDALIARTDSEGATLPLTPADLEALTDEIRTLGGKEKK